MPIPIDRIITRLDEYLAKRDNLSAERHLLYWLSEAQAEHDLRGCLTLCNELMGFYRKSSNKEEAVKYAERAVSLVQQLGEENNISGATSLLNAATVYNFASMSEKAAEIYESALSVYKNRLDENDSRFAGLYNNYATALVNLERYDEAEELYTLALKILNGTQGNECDCAVTYLNMADEATARFGTEASEKTISDYCEKAYSLLKSAERNSYFAFVCGKCAPVFGYYGYFLYEAELNELSEVIYERS